MKVFVRGRRYADTEQFNEERAILIGTLTNIEDPPVAASVPVPSPTSAGSAAGDV